MTSNNGYTVFEDELTAAHEGGFGEAGYEGGFEVDRGYGETGYESVWESAFEDEGGYGEAGYGEAGYEGAFEDETGYESAFEDEGGYGETGYGEAGYGEAGYGEAGYESAFEDETGYESAFEDEGGYGETGYGEAGYESAFEDESDQFFPLLGLAASALPSLFKAAAPLVQRLLPVARRAVGGVVRSVTSPPATRPQMGARPSPAYQPYRPGPAYPTYMPRPVQPAGPSYPVAGMAALRRRRRRRETVAGLLRRLASVLGEGESAATAAEASFFGSPESQFEVASSVGAHEAALTEVLAAEAAHTSSLPEAQAMLGAALPVTIRIMGARRVCGPYLPALAAANSRLVRTLATNGPDERQLLRVVPTIQRRAVASIMRAGSGGEPLSPQAVNQIMAGQAARVLGTPRLVGPALLRNH